MLRPALAQSQAYSPEDLAQRTIERRERLVSRRTGVITQIRAFLLERGIAVRQRRQCQRAELRAITPGHTLGQGGSPISQPASSQLPLIADGRC